MRPPTMVSTRGMRSMFESVRKNNYEGLLQPHILNFGHDTRGEKSSPNPIAM